ncbi:baculoviral IAP repeat-containing protein 7-like [Oscarella lobularis]|uniref:baculoviral IAP repeat-containing protein 7-like n=1 Tax=Oscarella lobularis TaxID=121494 RepID=UPI0033136FF2
MGCGASSVYSDRLVRRVLVGEAWSPESTSPTPLSPAYGQTATTTTKPETKPSKQTNYEIFRSHVGGSEIPICVRANGQKFYMDLQTNSWRKVPVLWYGQGKFVQCSKSKAEEVFQYNRYKNEWKRREELSRTVKRLENELEASESHRRTMMRESLRETTTKRRRRGKTNEDELREKIVELENRIDANLCKICFEDDMDVLLEPCKHLVVCSACALSIRLCPTCRKDINGKVKIFKS